ncbi:TPA: IS4/IS5 family transposase [Candidatus Poribacteria bacterium]|nr:IS4/IS5 family transposase [Candidatus Poribacteria bacterium]HIN75027.1 IS4/IS5 family transposase [Rhodospirillales bacterium]
MIDSQSVKTTALTESRGTDGYKKIKGLKRHLVVDAMVIPLGAQVTDAKVPDNQAAYQLLESVGFWCDTIQRLWADSGYLGDLEIWLLNQFQCQLEAVIQPKGKDFRVFAKRWILLQPLLGLHGIDH